MTMVSAILTTYNSAAYLPAAVESILAQTYQDLEILVIDDGSTDNTRAVLEPYLTRMRYVWQKNQERSAARNNGAHLATGRYLAFLDGDDIWLPDKITKQVAALEMYPQAVMTYGCAQIVDDYCVPTVWWGLETIGKLQGRTEEYREGGGILFGSSINPTIALIRADSFWSAGGFDLTIHFGEDWDLWIRLSKLGSFVRMPEIIAYYRTYGVERELKKRVSDHYLDRSLYLLSKNAQEDPARFSSELVLRAQANIYLQTALASYQLHDLDRGQAMFTEALARDVSLGKAELLLDIFEQTVRRIWRETSSEKAASDFLSGVLRSLPSSVQGIAPQLRSVMARALIAEAFDGHCAHNWAKVRNTVWRGLTWDPRWFLNRGVISIALQSLAHRE